MQKEFDFIYRIIEAKIDNENAWLYDYVGELHIRGYAGKTDVEAFGDCDDEYDFNIEEILFDGTNIYPILKTFDALKKIENACLEHIRQMFSKEDKSSAEPLRLQTHSIKGKLIQLPLKRKIK